MQPREILYIDFDGTLCCDRFWRSLPADLFVKIQESLFKGNSEMVLEWMKGRHISEEITSFVAEKTDIPFEYLWDTFVKDCKTMEISKSVLDLILRSKDRFVTVLCADNMDCLTRFTVPALSLEIYFDHIVSSFEYKKLKNDQNGELFDEIAHLTATPLTHSVLIDDSSKTIEMFQKKGGEGRLVTTEKNLEWHLQHLNF